MIINLFFVLFCFADSPNSKFVFIEPTPVAVPTPPPCPPVIPAAPPPPPCPPPPPKPPSIGISVPAPIPPPPAGFMQAPEGAMTIKRKVQTKVKILYFVFYIALNETLMSLEILNLIRDTTSDGM